MPIYIFFFLQTRQAYEIRLLDNEIRLLDNVAKNGVEQ